MSLQRTLNHTATMIIFILMFSGCATQDVTYKPLPCPVKKVTPFDASDFQGMTKEARKNVFKKLAAVKGYILQLESKCSR